MLVPEGDGRGARRAYHGPDAPDLRMSDRAPAAPALRNDELLSPVTQIVGNRADYLGEGQSDVGQRVADDKLELFVNGDPAQAMLQQFAQLAPDFIVLHDIGVSTSLRLLSAIASATGSKLQQLSTRRQGHGVALATLRFVEIAGRGSGRLRLYTTDIDADSQARRALAAVLLGHSHLGVLMVGELPPHALDTALQPLRDAIRIGPWPNRHLLLVPLGAPAALAAQAASLAGPPGLAVHVTPQPMRPNDAWSYVTGAWNRLRDGGVEPPPRLVARLVAHPVARPVAHRAPAVPPPQDAPTDMMPLRMPNPAAADLAPGRWDDYLRACSAIKGLMSACVFDFRTVRALAHCGSRPEPERLVTQGMSLWTAMAESSRGLGLGPSQPDAAITLTGHHLLLHPLPGHPGILLHAVLDASVANLTLARMQLQRIDATVLAAPTKL